MSINSVCLLVNWCISIQREVRCGSLFLIVMEFAKQLALSVSEDDESSSGETSSTSTGLALESILQRLPTCVNKEFIDEVLQLPYGSLMILVTCTADLLLTEP